MEEKNNKEKDKKRLNEEYGEFIPTEFSWIPPEKQKETAERLEKITKKRKSK